MTAQPIDFDEDEFDELDDFDSDDLVDVPGADHSYIKGMWGGFRQSGATTSQATRDDTVLAHGMVQSFVNAFARDGRYVVVFDPNTSTAGTDMKTKFVTITPAPIVDPKLTPEEAGVILTALAVHEISHPRYGRMTAQAVEKVFPGNATAQRVSNLLDDIRIEKRFVADYPGYAGIFDPALEYIGRAGQANGKLRKQTLEAPVNLAIAATRYPAFSDWSDPRIKAEFDWWNDWAVRGSREDAPARHVTFVREALLRIAALKAAQKFPPAPSAPAPKAPPQGGDGQGGNDEGEGEPTDDAPQSGSSGQGEGDPSDGAELDVKPMSDEDLNAATMPVPPWNPDATADETSPMNSCSGSDAVDKAAEENGTSAREISVMKSAADDIIEAARNTEADGHGSTVDVNKSLRGLGGGPRGVPSSLASKYIRNAIMQSRTGHTDHSPFKRHGRLDQRGLSRIANGDYRLFEKRTAPSVGRYNVWVMVDASSSMEWGRGVYTPLQEAAGVAHAMAAASQTVPTVRMSLWAWTDAFRRGSGASAGVALAWRTGMDPDQALRLSTVSTGGTPDAIVMGWAARAILRETAQEETPVIIFVSDGAGYGEMNERIEEARKMGVQVYGVSFSSGMDAVDEARFGKNNYVPWMGSIAKTARPLAKLFARITGGTR